MRIRHHVALFALLILGGVFVLIAPAISAQNALRVPVQQQPSCIGNCPTIVVPTVTPNTPSTPPPPEQPFPSPPLTVGTIGQDIPAEPWQNTDVGGDVCVDWLVYHGDQTGSWEIYRTGGLNLSQGPGLNVGNIQPSLSPDRDFVAFTTNRDDGNWELYLANADGSGVRRITWNTGVDINPVWGKGSRIVFESNRDANWELYMFDVATGETRRLTDFSEGSDIDANWSPDGSTIVFSRAINGRYELFTMNMTTFEETQITQNDVDDIGAQFSPDGTKLAWLQRDAATGIYNLMMRDLTLPENQDDDNTNNIDVTLAAIGANINLAVWAPSGNFIAFDSNVDGDYDVFVVETELEDGATTYDIKNVTQNNDQDRAPTFLCNSDIVIFQSDSMDEARNYDLFDVDAGVIEPDAELNAPNQLTDLEQNEIYAVNTITDEDGSREGRLP